MKKIKPFFVVIMLLLMSFADGQNMIEIEGIVLVNNTPIENVHVINLSNEKTAVTNAKGDFLMEVQEGDLLTFNAVNLDFWRQSIKQENIDSKKIVIYMTEKVTELEDVTVTQYVGINAFDLGIIDHQIKTKTVAERRMYNGTQGLDGFINMLTGRKKMLKKGVEYERMQMLADKIELMFEEEYFTEQLKIPADYVRGFIDYCSDDLKLAAVVNERKKLDAEFILAEKATTYLTFFEEAKMIEGTKP
uniref:hypothetical protein n=1 Tax=Flavobacterium sp. TaxID=239 RepID=UPI00404A0343